MKEKFQKYIKELEFSQLYKQLLGAYENYKRSNSNLWANTLSYFTLLSLIPMLAIVFSIGSWFDLDQYYLKQLLKSSPLNTETLEMLLNTANSLLENTRSGVIAGVGFISLAWIMISMFSTIEKALNSIWNINKTRPFFRKLTDYLTTFFILPVCIVIARIFISIKIGEFHLGSILGIIAPYIALWLFFIMFYAIMPNTKVGIVANIWSSFIISFLLNQSNMLIVKLQIVIGTYNKIYGSFSVLLLSLIWLKIVWFLILIGAHFTYILENRNSLTKYLSKKKLNFESRFEINKIILMKFVDNYLTSDRGLTLKEIEKTTLLNIEILIESITQLKKMGYISELKIETETERSFRLTKNIEQITASDLEENMKKIGDSYQIEPIEINKKERFVDYLEEKNHS